MAAAPTPNSPATKAYITVVIASGDDTVSWSDPDGCSSDYNIYKAITPSANYSETSHIHLVSAAPGSTQATLDISHSEDDQYPAVEVELYCGTYDAASSQNLLISSTQLSIGWTSLVGINIREGTYSSAPLTALTISSGMLSPDFDRGLGRYSAEVPSDVEVITLDPTVLTGYQTDFVKNPGSYTVTVCSGPWHLNCVYSYGDGTTTGIVLSDADTDTEGFQINLDPGENRLGIGVHKGPVTAWSAKTYPLTITRAANTPATGQPTINGTAQVGEVLEVDTSGIADADGLANVTFSYQWLSSRDTEIGGATSSTYTLQPSDEGKTISVQVSFTDDGGNEETLTSAQTATVEARSNSAGICDRTERVRDNIIGLLNAQDLGSLGIKDCSEVTDEQLTRIRFLDLAGGGTGGKITSLKSGDFEGLSGMSELNLEDNSLSKLPEGVFDGLSSLELLTMHGNDLSSLPDGVFDDLTKLHTLGLYDNDLAALPDGIFDALTKLRTLAISGNKLTALSGDVFTGLGGLASLVASNNKLTSLPDGVFSGMSKLQSVSFSGNPSAPFTLTAELERQGEDGVVVKVSEGAPFAMTVTLSAEGGTLSATTVVIGGGDTESADVTVTPEGAGAVTVSVDSAAFPDAGTVHDGIQTGVGESLTLEAAASGICDRTVQVRDAILEKLDHVSDCADVTAADLSGITGYLLVWSNEALTLKFGDFAGLDNVSSMGLSQNQISILPEDVFNGLDNLKVLLLYLNQLTSLPEDIFDGLGSLEELWLSHNQLSELPEDVFDRLGNLKTLRLEGNQLSALPEDVFDGLESLESLSLGRYGYGNQLSELPEDVFDGLGSLESLGLTGNQISALPEQVFDGLDSLEELYLISNQISTLPEDVFDGLDSLEELYLGLNQISTLPEDVFDGLGSLENLFLNYNQFSELPEDVFDGLGSLESLQLTGNQISVLPEEVFDSLISLRSLGLSGNQIGVLPDDVFDGLDSLTFLNLNFNQISVLPDDVFTGLDSLTQLIISNNQIAGLPEGVFDGLSQLYRLELNGNQLSELPEGVFDGLGSLLQLWLSNNPGAPFTFTAVLEQRGDNVIRVKVAHGAPVSMSVSLSAAGGNLSDDTATVAGGSLESDAITVTATGGGAVTVSVESADFVKFPPENINGIQTGVGDPLTLAEEEGGNTPATGAPTVSGIAQVGESLTADTSGIADEDGLTNVSFDYRWLSDDTAIQGATDFTYALVEGDEGKAIKVQVSFSDDGGNEETLTSAPTGPVLTGPVLGDGLPGAPRNLTATPGNKEITLSWDPPDDNGNAPATRYRIEWRIDGKDYKKGHWGPSGKTTYTKTDLANGVKYIFRVKAENGNGNSYGPYGPASEEVSATPTSGLAVDLGTPVLSNTKTLHHGMVKLDWEDIEGAGWYVVQYYHVKSGEWLDLPTAGVDIAFHGSSAVVSNLHGLSWLRVRAMSCAGESEWSQIEELYGTKASDWEDVPVPEVAEGDQIDPCPVILGTPVLSGPETLHHGMVRLDWQDIEDAGRYVVQYYHVKGGEWLDLPAEGVDIAFHGSSAVVSNLHGLSWLRVRAMSCAGASEWSQIEELYGTNASDWEGVPVPEVEEGDEIEPCPEDADTPDNSPATGAPTISGTAQAGETLTANTSGIADEDGLENVTFSYQWLADNADISGATGFTYTLADNDEGKVIKVTVSFTDDAGNGEALTSGTTEAVAAAPTPNTPATGAPTISGTAQVGETLTADSSGVADADGLSNVQYEYQWLADDTAVQGATDATYTLAVADEGKAIKVQVSFTDDAGNDETLTSAATDAVAAAPQPNSPATGAPTISGTAQVGQTLTANTSGVADADGLSNVQYEYQWLADDTDIAGATNATYTLTDSEESKAITVQVSFTDDADNEETLTSAATDVVAGAQPTEPPAKPRNLEATATHDSVTLTWDDPGDNTITGYVILRRIPGVDPQGHFDELVANTGSAATTYTDDTVAAETRYTYRIKAINGAGTSERSRWRHIDTPAAPVPAKPTGLEATESHGQVVLTWDDPGDDTITGYVILRRVRVNNTGGDFSVLVADTGTAATTYTDDTVAAGTTYTYRIKAINEHGTSERSRWFHIDIPEAP